MVTTTKTQNFRKGFQKLTHSDDQINRIQDNIQGAVSPVLNLFSGSPGTATITWGTGTPTFSAPTGSLYLRTDSVGSTTAVLWVRNTSLWIVVK